MKPSASLFVSAVLLFSAQNVFAWGGRGHHVICSAAVHLVSEPGLKVFLQGRGHTMGHLCNVPDIYWKSLPKEISKIGDATHFLDPEITGVAIPKLPLDFAVLEKEYTGQDNKFQSGKKIFSFAEDFGSLWWRVEQFSRRLIAQKDAFASAKPPQERKEEQDDKLPYNQQVYEMMVNMGLMGHFVGDAGQPLHNTADYDGYEAEHGGLHSYYEEQALATAPADLEARVYTTAKSLKGSWLKPGPIPARMRDFSAMIAKDLPQVFKLDPILKKSEVKKEKGMSLRTPAERQGPNVGWKRFEKMTVRHLASSARLLAAIWDETYVAMGKPDLAGYRSYRYPFTPDFVAPDYISNPSAEKPAQKN
ncbi:MAG: hypothetical protein KF789_05215 [Bdellovibrionaceae bacterium]|nr:hypothetical protein [Pseudobdellovibrionaceae bacterium]